jgi:ABC-type nickel/cobalt efflux system permease component RcnA
MEAGSSVMTLFRNRGWTSIITDMMVDTVLFMVSVGVGALTALSAVLIGLALSMGDASTLGAAAVLAFILGYGMAATLFSVVSSAVNTVIVCYAEAPNEFQANHPQLSDRMRGAWRQAWPNEFGY